MKEFLKRTKDTNKAKEFFLDKMSFTIGCLQLKKILETDLNDYNIFDLRDYEKYMKSHIPFAMHIPADQFEEQIGKFAKDRVNILYDYGRDCHLAYKCAYLLSDKGYPVMTLTDGFHAWKKHDFDVIEDDVSNYPG